ncbi:phosphatase PAP2 family protein [Stieleria varia]|nr:phosphatase PAP2 family protein [Stieleria varia]
MKRASAAVVSIVRFLRSREPIVLVGLLLIVAGTWGFVELADEVIEGDTGSFDRWAVRQFRSADDAALPIGPTWMAEMGRDITGLGGVAVLTLFIIAATGFLAIHRAYRTMVVLVASTVGGITVSMLLKQFFDRPRPDVVPHLSQIYSSSFPSGHSMMSAVVYLTLAAIVAPVLKHFWVRFYVMACAVLLTGLIGISRVYMGVHYPTDVLAGWTAGLVWAIACSLIAKSIPEKRLDPVMLDDEADADQP